MMRFPIQLIHSEVNDKLCSENAYNALATIPRKGLGLIQAATYPPRSIIYDDDNKQTVIEKFQNENPPFRMWIDSLLNNDWIGRCKDIMLSHFFKYCTIATTKYNFFAREGCECENNEVSRHSRGGKGF
jgi:hypothetical protein